MHPTPIPCGPPARNDLHIQEVLRTSNPSPRLSRWYIQLLQHPVIRASLQCLWLCQLSEAVMYQSVSPVLALRFWTSLSQHVKHAHTADITAGTKTCMEKKQQGQGHCISILVTFFPGGQCSPSFEFTALTSKGEMGIWALRAAATVWRVKQS